MILTENYVHEAMRSTFYQKKLKNVSLAAWENIPFTTKSELRDANAFDLLGTELKNIASYHETSGTTGNPTSSWYSFQDVQRESEIVVHSDLRLSDEDLVLNRYTFTLAVASYIFNWACQYAKSGHICIAKSHISTYKRVLETIARTHPTILADIPFELEILAGVAKQLNWELPTKHLRALLVAGELFPPARKRWLEKLWGVPAYNLFGSTETGGLFMSCSHGHFHLNNPHIKLEVVDEAGNPLGFGEMGHCVISTQREGMPVLRYWNEDLVEIRGAGQCACGRTEPIVIHYGRKEDSFQTQNKTVTMYDLINAVYSLTDVPMLWRIHLTQRDEVLFEYQSFAGVEDRAASMRLREELQAQLGIRLEVKHGMILGQEDLYKESSVTKYKYIIRP